MRLGIRSTLKRLFFSLTGPVESWYFRYRSKQYAGKNPINVKTPAWFVTAEQGKVFLLALPQSEQQCILADAQRILQGDFSILGCHIKAWDRSGLFNTDLHNGYKWPLVFHRLVDRLPGDNRDIKFPWELSQFQFLPVLGQAYWISGNEKIADFAIKLIARWLTENPYLFGANWSCPMKASIRACNWLWAWYFFEKSSAWTQDFSDGFWKSLWLHGKYIERNLEDWGAFRQNHFLGDIVGLLLLGIMCPWFSEADQWKEFSVQQIARSMQEQIYSDGVDFENSTGYHRLVLEFFACSAILCQNNKIELPAEFWDRLEKMFDYVLAYVRPDGQAPLLGDSDDGRMFIFSNFTDWTPADHRYLLDLGAALFHESKYKLEAEKFSPDAWWLVGEKGQNVYQSLRSALPRVVSQSFTHGGIYFLRNNDVYVMISAANPGNHGAGTHQHNDALHFELCIGQQPVMIDSGTYCYSGDEAARNKFRSTLAHNTIQVDGEEQNIPDGIFSVNTAGKARINIHKWETNAINDILVASHDGYADLASSVNHCRSFQFDKVQSRLTVVDKVKSKAGHSLIIRFHLAKGLNIQWLEHNPMEWMGIWGPVKVTLLTSVPAEFVCDSSSFSPSYFVSYERPMVEIRCQTGVNGFTGTWLFEFSPGKVLN